MAHNLLVCAVPCVNLEQEVSRNLELLGKLTVDVPGVHRGPGSAGVWGMAEVVLGLRLIRQSAFLAAGSAGTPFAVSAATAQTCADHWRNQLDPQMTGIYRPGVFEHTDP